MLRHVIVGDNEIIFVIRKRRFAGILEAGERWIFGRGIELERHNTRQLALASEWADVLVRQHPELAARYFAIVETGDAQVAVVYLDGRLARVVPPAQRVLYFRGAREVTFDVIDVRAEPEVPAALVASLGAQLPEPSNLRFTHRLVVDLEHVDRLLLGELEAVDADDDLLP